MTCLSLLVMPLLMQPSILLAFCAAAALFPHIELVHQHPQVPIWENPSLFCIPGLSFLGLRLYTLSLLNFMRHFQPIQAFMQRAHSFPKSPLRHSVDISQLYQGTLNPVVQITYGDYEQHWAQYQSLGYPNCDRMPDWKGDIYHQLLGYLDHFYDSDL